MANELTGLKIKDTYARVVQIISGSYYDGLGNPIIITGSATDISGLVTTSSFNSFTASYNSGSFTGSFKGVLNGTASYALNAGMNNPMIALGDIIIGSASGVPIRLPGNINSSPLVLTAVGDGTSSVSVSWQPPAVLGVLVYYFATASSDVAAYNKQTTTIQTLTSSITNTGVVNGQLLAKFITEPSNPNRTYIPFGEYSNHIHAIQSAGTKTTQLYTEIWEESSTGVDIALIAALGPSTVLTGTTAEYQIATSRALYTLSSASSRIATKVYAKVDGGGSAPNITLYVGDSADSRTNLPAPILDITNYVPYTGATRDLDMTGYSVTADRFNGYLAGNADSADNATHATESDISVTSSYAISSSITETISVVSTLPAGAQSVGSICMMVKAGYWLCVSDGSKWHSSSMSG